MAQESNNTQNVDSERQSQLATVLIGILIVVAGFLIYSVFSNNAQDAGNDVTLPGDEVTDGSNQATPTPETAEQPTGGRQYVVRAGDTLWEIAQAAFGDGYQWTAIADANDIPHDTPGLEEGTVIIIPAIGGPDEGTDGEETGDDGEEPTEAPEPTKEPEPTEEPEPTATPEPTEEPEPTATPEPTQEPEPTEEPEPTATPAPEEGDEGDDSDSEDTAEQSYTVVEGDTLWSIAVQFYGSGFEWQRIFDANDITMYTSVTTGITYPLIEPGQALVIPAL